MKILAIDTASNLCGVSILENENLLVKSDQDTGRTHSENLMPIIQKAFATTHLSLSDIDLIVCDKGPGSFTGIRIGLATAKAFYDSIQIPCIGVTSLETYAYQIKKECFIASIMDCKNNNCYFSLYELKEKNYIEHIAPTACSLEDVFTKLSSFSNTPITFIGDGIALHKELIKNSWKHSILAPQEQCILDSYCLGLAGFRHYQSSPHKISEELLPLYLKKPQAQLQLEKKLLQSQ